MKNIQLIAWNTIRELAAKKTVYLLLFAVFFVVAAVGTEFYSIFQNAPSDPQAFTARKAQALGSMLLVWSSLTILVAIIFASGLIHNEKKEKTILGVMAKPVDRWEFLMGKWGGVQLFFYGFLAAGIFIAIIFMVIWDISLTTLFWTGVVNYITTLFVFSGIALVLSLFISRVISGGIAIILWLFRIIFEDMMGSSNSIIYVLGHIMYYISPARIEENLIEKGILDNLLNPEYALFWSVIAENFLYGAVVFIVGAFLFQRRDIVLG